MRVRFIGPVKQAVGEEQRVLTLKKGTAEEIFENILRLHPEAKESLKRAGVFTEGRMIKETEFRQAILKDGQEVSLILPVAGG